MNSFFHQMITIDALSGYFSASALGEVILNNIRQDSIKNQLFHNEIHFDNNKFFEGNQYITSHREQCIEAIKQQNYHLARKFFGNLIHTAQDFYAHSNYARLYEQLKSGDLNPSACLDCLSSEFLHSSKLKSHTVHFPGDYLCVIPQFANRFGKYLPEDSHARMNLDSPESDGPFYLAYALAVTRTKLEHQEILSSCPASEQLLGFHSQ